MSLVRSLRQHTACYTIRTNVTKELKDADKIPPYDRMQVWENNGPGILQFSNNDLLTSPILGGIVEDASLVAALWE